MSVAINQLNNLLDDDKSNLVKAFEDHKIHVDPDQITTEDLMKIAKSYFGGDTGPNIPDSYKGKELFGTAKREKINAKNTFQNIVDDSHHIYFSQFAHIYISEVRGNREKAELLCRDGLLNTKILSIKDTNTGITPNCSGMIPISMSYWKDPSNPGDGLSVLPFPCRRSKLMPGNPHCSLSIVLIVSLALVLLVPSISSRISKPIETLRDQADRMSRGDLNTRVEILGDNEINDLANSFNLMASHLGELTGSLESQVRDRTGQLEASFEELKRTQNELINRERYKTLGAVAAGLAHR
jgi:methyl-accepting chemotaxis protein